MYFLFFKCMYVTMICNLHHLVILYGILKFAPKLKSILTIDNFLDCYCYWLLFPITKATQDCCFTRVSECLWELILRTKKFMCVNANIPSFMNPKMEFTLISNILIQRLKVKRMFNAEWCISLIVWYDIIII